MRPAWALSSSIVLAAIPLRADDVVVTLHGESISFHSVKGGASRTCMGDCTITVPAGTYVFTAPEVEETISLVGPTTVTYRPKRASLRTSGAILAGAGVLVVIGGVYGALEICKESYDASTGFANRPCKDGPTATRAQNLQYALLGAAGIGFTAAVVGGFLYFGSGASLSFDAPLRDTQGSWAVAAIAPVPGGLALSLSGTF